MTYEEELAHQQKILDQYNFGSSMIPVMTKYGWGLQEQSNILHQFKFESDGKPQRPENLNYRPEIIVQKFGKRPHFAKMTPSQKLEEAKRIKALGPEAIANAAYGGILGNAMNEGYKYRGRGFVQITGKDNYKRVGEIIGVDLVNNPDLILKDRTIDERASLAYMRLRQKDFKLDYKDLKQVSKAITGEDFQVRQAKAEKRNMLHLTENEISALRPADDPQLLADMYSGKISEETYYERRGY
jgi:putative chitinase